MQHKAMNRTDQRSMPNDEPVMPMVVLKQMDLRMLELENAS
jgi:hypothetical protein